MTSPSRSAALSGDAGPRSRSRGCRRSRPRRSAPGGARPCASIRRAASGVIVTPRRVVGARLAVEELRRLALQHPLEHVGATVPSRPTARATAARRTTGTPASRAGRSAARSPRRRRDRSSVRAIRSKPCCEPLTIRISSARASTPNRSRYVGEIRAKRRIAARPAEYWRRALALLADHLVQHAAEGVGREQSRCPACRPAKEITAPRARRRDQRARSRSVVGRHDARAARQEAVQSSAPGAAIGRPAAAAGRRSSTNVPCPTCARARPEATSSS